MNSSQALSQSSSAAGHEAQDFVEVKDKELARIQIKEEQRFMEAEKEITRMLNGLKVQRAASYHLDEQLTEQIQQVQEGITNALRDRRQERYSLNVKLQQVIDERLAEVHGHAAEEAALYKEQEVYSREITDEICHLYRDVDQNSKFRHEQGETIAQAIHSKLREVSEAVEAEKRIRNESRSTLLELFGQMAQKMEMELEQSRYERHAFTDRVVSLMEQTLPQYNKPRHAGEVSRGRIAA
eukprot:TRINITY_DN65651_c0_g1_i1.p1 TRINITY_DN65651_c0_g1~~TRINITY_DN65651_c0_g1_i1.p1  ORF type:complete len:256 (+),score=79.76 TRINITY_DN65651_c0_g1_i1:49-768(+)